MGQLSLPGLEMNETLNDSNPDRVESSASDTSPRKAKKTLKSKATKSAARKTPTKEPRKRRQRPFPTATFEDALYLPSSILRFAPGGRIRRLTLFNELNKSPDSGPSRQLITHSNAYGLTTGSYQAEFLELTPEGTQCIASEVSNSDRFRARVRLAILHIELFKALFEAHAGQKLPSKAVLKDFLKDHNVDEEDRNDCFDCFISNAKYVGLLKTVAGAERLLTVDHAVEELPKQTLEDGTINTLQQQIVRTAPGVAPAADFSSVCFYIAPIGDEGSEQRQHSDMFLESFVEPALV